MSKPAAMYEKAQEFNLDALSSVPGTHLTPVSQGRQAGTRARARERGQAHVGRGSSKARAGRECSDAF